MCIVLLYIFRKVTIILYNIYTTVYNCKGFFTTALTKKTTEPIWLKVFNVIPDSLLTVLVPLLLVKISIKFLEN